MAKVEVIRPAPVVAPPPSITLHLSIAEAARVLRLVGKTSFADEPTASIYNQLRYVPEVVAERDKWKARVGDATNFTVLFDKVAG